MLKQCMIYQTIVYTRFTRKSMKRSHHNKFGRYKSKNMSHQLYKIRFVYNVHIPRKNSASHPTLKSIFSHAKSVKNGYVVLIQTK